MSNIKRTDFVVDHIFDSETSRHYINGEVSVFHCHHYATLYTQLAIDADELVNGKALLAQSAEDSFYDVFSSYFLNNKLSFEEKIQVIENYYSFIGLGRMEVKCFGMDSGEVVLKTSHLDEGWKIKFGKYDEPVNYITSGFISAFFSVINNKSTRTYNAQEVMSMVKGDEYSKFLVVKN
jgi:predicted hydrocarbon binding protein